MPSIHKLREELTLSEFLDWLEFIRREESRRTKQDIYLAQIAAEIRRTMVTKPKAVKIEHFFLQMSTPEGRDRVKRSKANWSAGLKLNLDK